MLDGTRLEEIYNSYKVELFVYISRLLQSPDSAEDLLHDCFENLIRYSQKYVLEDRNLRSFLYKTAHNLCINRLKHEKRFPRVELEEDSKIIDDGHITGLVELDELNRTIYELIKNLDELTRSVFVMRKELDMDVEAIAANLGVSERTVRRKLNRALEFLLLSLKKKGFL